MAFGNRQFCIRGGIQRDRKSAVGAGAEGCELLSGRPYVDPVRT